MEYTDEERQDHFSMVLDAIETLQKNEIITEEWLHKHTKQTLKIRETLQNIAIVHEEIDDDDFRRKAREAEAMLQHLVYRIYETGQLDLTVYLMFNQRIYNICTCIFTEDELEGIFGNLSI